MIFFKHVCVNFIEFFPIVELRIRIFNVENTSFKISLGKMVKHGKCKSTINMLLYYLHLTHLTF